MAAWVLPSLSIEEISNSASWFHWTEERGQSQAFQVWGTPLDHMHKCTMCLQGGQRDAQRPGGQVQRCPGSGLLWWTSFSPDISLQAVHSSFWANPFSAAWESKSFLPSARFALPKRLAHFPVPVWSLAFHRHGLKHASFSLGRQSLSTHWLLDCKELSKSSNRTDCSASTSPSTFYRCENRFAEKKATPVHSGYSQTLMYTSSSTPIRPKVEMIT